MRRSSFRMALVGAMASCMPTLAHASGQLPVPPSTEQFKSHEACLAALEDTYAQDKKQIRPKKREANGDTREVTLDTKGIESLGPNHARYEATLWYHNGRLDSELQKTETSHTYERLLSECTDKTLQTSGENGYTLSTFDP